MIVGLYAIIELIYAALSARFIFGGDSAEFSTVGSTWSIAHAPGYPLYTLFSNLIRYIPLSTVPWRISLISSFSAIISAYMIYKLLKLNGIHIGISILSSILFLVLFPVWQYSLIPEVFLPNIMLISIATYCVFAYLLLGKKNKYIYLFSFVVGLCVSNHHTFILFIPAWFFLLWRKIKWSKKLFFFSLALFILGALFYLYPYIASSFNPPIDWENTQTLQGLWRLITRSTYGTFSIYTGAKPNGINNTYDFFAAILFAVQDFRIPGVLLIIFGFIIGKKTKPALFAFLFVSFICQIIFLTYSSFSLISPFASAMYERFLISTYYILVLIIALSLHYIIARGKKYRRAILGIFFVYVFVIALQGYATIRAIRNLNYFDKIGNDIIDTVPSNGILSVSSDNTYFPAIYQLYALKKRKDIVFIPINILERPYELLRLKKGGQLKNVPTTLSFKNGSAEAFFKANESRGIYLENPLNFGYWMPRGLLWKYYSSEKELIKERGKLLKKNDELWDTHYDIPPLNDRQKNILHLQVVQDYYLNTYENYAKYLYLQGEYEKTIQVINTILTFRPRNVGLIFTKVNIFVQEKKCGDAYKTISGAQMGNSYLHDHKDILSSVINYYDVCDSHNPKVIDLKKLLK